MAAALGEALQAIVVDGDDAAARRGRAPEGGRRVGVDARGRRRPTARRFCRRVPPGARRLASCVRSAHPSLDRLLTRLLAPFVLVDGGLGRGARHRAGEPGV